MISSTTELKPNDVAVILRPNVVDGVWSGSFDVMVSGIGPVTIKDIDMDQMIGMGVMLASVVPLMEHDKEIASQIVEYCNNNYSNIGEFELAEEEVEVVTSLDINTRCVGGVQ
jgi:hypothetical protein